MSFTRKKRAGVAGASQAQIAQQFLESHPNIGDEVEARCAGYGYGGFWPAVIVDVIKPAEQEEGQTLFVLKWAQDPQVDNLKSLGELRRRRPKDWLTTGSARIGLFFLQ
jgi:hypothetical protein